ncbi:MAG: HAD family phosphatase [Nitrospirae bacterium]|nr:MAG: HAD family phosphatase [Nitrospirota bacterium]
MAHRLLLWDLGNVLVRVDPVRAALAATGGDAAAARRLVAAIVDGPAHDAFERGRLDPEGFHRALVAAGLIHLDYPAFARMWTDMFELDAGAAALLARAARRCRCWLLSNTDPLHHPWIMERWPLERHLSGATLSYRVGSRKPEAAIFRAALEAAGVGPEEAGFVDDREEHVAAARALGIDAVRYTGPEALERWLAERGDLEG